ncbi:MAG: hypothetical protein APF80_06680 [Alphaproteobacteria bacterium BRH_c36]|nr:MAG: hypothetical protein APF80_06680 [Alphaproteobacteria bacterium BRH_c36]
MKSCQKLRIAVAAWILVAGHAALAAPARPATWSGDLTPIAASEWNERTAAHLLERAGFGGTPAEIAEFAKLGAVAAVRRLVHFEGVSEVALPPFDHSGVHDPGLEPFPPSRPATTNLASKNGKALGIKVKPSGNRRLQPVVNKFFYWLRASRLETDRVGYWWADRMLRSPRPLQEKIALFWHGHFAVNEDKVRDYRKHLQLLQIFHEHGLGNFRELLVATAKSPGMLSFLDAGVNVKGAPNENFAREIMELFTLGVGHYTEHDIREAARAFTGWNYKDLGFVINELQHDTADKTVLGRTGNFSGEDIVDILLEKPADEFIAAKLYRYFVHDDPSRETVSKLAEVLRSNDFRIAALMETIFLSRDFYSAESVGTIIKSPVQLAVSTYRKLELDRVPGVPDFNTATATLGQHLFNAPTVAGWAQGRAWITPGLLIARKNFAYDLMFPDINFIPSDRYPDDPLIRSVSKRLEDGANISNATKPPGVEDIENMSMANLMADMDQDFNTRYGSYRGWQMALEKVKPIPRYTAGFDLAGIVARERLTTVESIVDHFFKRLLSVPASSAQRAQLLEVLRTELGTDDIEAARSYVEDALRVLVHRIMSLPEYQLG